MLGAGRVRVGVLLHELREWLIRPRETRRRLRKPRARGRYVSVVFSGIALPPDPVCGARQRRSLPPAITGEGAQPPCQDRNARGIKRLAGAAGRGGTMHV